VKLGLWQDDAEDFPGFVETFEGFTILFRQVLVRLKPDGGVLFRLACGLEGDDDKNRRRTFDLKIALLYWHAEDAFDAQRRVVIEGVCAGMERLSGGFAAKLCRQGLDWDVLQLDAEKVRRQLTLILDGVALEAAGADAEGSGVGGGPVDNFSVWPFVGDVDDTAVVEVDVDRRDGGMVVHGDELMRAVVDALHEDVGVIENGLVVRRKRRGALGVSRRGNQGWGSQAKDCHSYELTPQLMICTAPRPTSDSTCSMKATSAATETPAGSMSTANWSGSSRRSISLPVPGED